MLKLNLLILISFEGTLCANMKDFPACPTIIAVAYGLE